MRSFVPITETANRAIGYAQREAQRLDHAYVEPEHLLLGLAIDAEGTSSRLMRQFGVDLRKFRLRVEQTLEPGDALDIPEITLSPRARRTLKLAEAEASSLGQYGVEDQHILLALLRDETEAPAKLLAAAGLTYGKVRTSIERSRAGKRMEQNASRAAYQTLDFLRHPIRIGSAGSVPVEVSPVFIGISLITILAGSLLYLRVLPRVMLILFVAGGWIISLCLHEFGHAYVGYLGGDREVYYKGYLTLNPVKYTHPILSIVLPLVFLFLGGIGLPGGAVYINRHAIRDRRTLSLMSAAGPFATLCCAVILLIPFVTGLAYADLNARPEFWAALALLTMLEISGVVLNLIPFPGIDGYGIIAPYLPPRIAARLTPLYQFTFLFLVLLFLTPLGGVFWRVVSFIASAVNLHPDLVWTGLDLFRFWM